MFLFKKKNDKQKNNIKAMTEEITKIWSENGEMQSTDVNGSYTGNPKDSTVPVQDADDL